ncbi:MAG: outer membrane protein assembly factor BamD [Alphaproteobacteria bacterium]|nr:outer membrane protein assembly factor BamD [Alphaproteobacteria bacterium]
MGFRAVTNIAVLQSWRRAARAVAVLLVVGLLAACDSTPEETYVERPVEELYASAHDEMLEGNFANAARGFDEVERQHPYSPWATRAQVMAAFCYYQDNDYDQTVIAARRFVELHPGHEDTPYAYYLIAVSYYEQISDVGRDQGTTVLALDALEDVGRRYPNSAYAKDSKLKLDLARDHLAGKEMEIGRYYLIRGHYIAAANRFREVIERYQTTSHSPEALHRLTEAYLSLGIKREAQTAAAVLGHNFPNSAWYRDSYALLAGVNLEPEEDEGSWISRAFNYVF